MVNTSQGNVESGGGGEQDGGIRTGSLACEEGAPENGRRHNVGADLVAGATVVVLFSVPAVGRSFAGVVP